jgi:hypothetical protein
MPKSAKEPPADPDWIHEIKHDGFHIMARRDANDVRLYTRNGYNFARRFPKIVDAVRSLPAKSCFIDGEAIAVDANGLSTFELLRSWRHDHAAVLCAFDVIELNGKDLPDADRGSQARPGQPAVSGARRHHLQSALRRRRRRHLQAGMRARLRGHRVKTARLDLSLGPCE